MPVSIADLIISKANEINLKLDLDMANSHNIVQAALWTHHYSNVYNVAIVMTNVR